MMTSNQLRQAFLNYFKNKGHTIVPSSSLVPHNDATLLFTNAGMVQFKDVFLGRDQRDYSRAVSSQNCVRAGGKHNDLENVGYTARHHTYFEMLGNFSFGDYFKHDAIRYAWEFLTQDLAIPKEKLWITVYEADDEAALIWQNEIGLPAERIIRCGEKSNFWSMGDTGPCGPCTEIFYDHGADIAGGLPGTPEEDGDRYIEIWNLVFMQYDRAPDGSLQPLPKPSVDTGMGLERITAVMQHVHNNYETDIFQTILEAISQLTNNPDLANTSMRVIADHIRSCTFLILDGVLPSNEGRGYVLRRIIRRAIRHGHKLGLTDNFFYKLVAPLIATMGEAYPQLTTAQAQVEKVLHQEENQFIKTLDQGMRILEQDLAELTTSSIPGATIFRLYDTYGFPPDLTGDIARERNLVLDMEGFEKEMAKQRALSQNASKFTVEYNQALNIQTETEFTGYQALETQTTVTELFHETQNVSQLRLEESGSVVLQHTPFYAESGGQVGDQGLLETATGVFLVTDTQKRQKAIIHLGHVVSGHIETGQLVTASVNMVKRQATALNHSATHLLHAALRTIIGGHVQQKGSLVSPARLRFDFAHGSPLTDEQLLAVERLVNRQIMTNNPVETHLISQEEALKRGAIALFGEKYSEQVRVLQMGNFSMELCGGTHVSATGEIGLFKIVQETGVAAGVRRIEALTGEAALDFIAMQQQTVMNIAQLLKTSTDNVATKIQETLLQYRALQKQIEQLSSKLARNVSDELIAQAEKFDYFHLIVGNVQATDIKGLRELADQIKGRVPESIIVLATVADGKVHLLTSVGKTLFGRIHAGELANYLATHVGGKGGGRADQAQAGGSEPEKLEGALQLVKPWIIDKI